MNDTSWDRKENYFYQSKGFFGNGHWRLSGLMRFVNRDYVKFSFKMNANNEAIYDLLT